MRKISVLCFVVFLLFAVSGCFGFLISDELGENLEQEPASIAEIWEIRDEYEFVFEMSVYIAEKCDYGSDLDALSEPERVFYITQTLEAEVNNGGFWQFFFNAGEDVFCEVTSSFSEIGAKKTAALCSEAIAAFDEELPSDRASRMKLLMDIGMEQGYDLLSVFDEAFYTYEEDLTVLNYEYIQNNKDAFS